MVVKSINLSNSATSEEKLQKVLAIHDLSGYSHTSLMAVIPIFSKMNISVCALPTAILSSNTEHEGFELVNLTNHLQAFLNHWQKLNLQFSAIYSGFLSDASQVEIVIKAIEMFKSGRQLIVVDPVMADDGELYSCFSTNIVSAMQRLITYAEVITPNLTEAALLVDEPYNSRISMNQVENQCRKLAAMGPDKVIITSVPTPHNTNTTSVVSYNKTTDRMSVCICKYMPVNYPGTGDIFTSILTGNLLKGLDMDKSIGKAVNFVSEAISLTIEMNLPTNEGICLEQALNRSDII